MKTTIKRRAKSALAVLLTLCLVMSVFTIGISSVSAAVDDSEGVGSYNVNAKIYVEKPSSWTNVSVIVGKSDYSTAYKMTQITGTNLYYKNVSWDGATEVAFMDADWGNSPAASQKISDRWGGVTNKTSIIGESDWKYENGNTYRVTISGSVPTSTYYSGGYSDLNKTLTIKTAYSENGDNYAETSTKYGTFSASGAYKLTADGTSGTSSVSQTNGTGTLVTVRTNTATISQTPNSGYTFVGWKTSLSSTGSGLSSTYSFTNSGSDATVYAYYKKTKTTLTTPTNVQINNASTYAVNAGDSSTTTLTWTGDSNANGYTIYKDGTQVGTSSTTSYPLSNATSAAGTYTVKATNTDTSNYINSGISTSSATLTVYSPEYCLVGNDIRDDAFLINGETPSKTDPTGTATWFNTWQESFAVNTPTGTPGVYKITFTVRDDYEWSPDVEIYQKTGASTGEQRGFILNGSAYNISTHGDITVNDSGIDWGANLYAYPLGTPAGGSLVLKKGQTYTITIDQTQRYNSSSPYGKIKVETGDIFAETAAKKQVFNATNRSYDAVSDAATTIGTASSLPVHGPKNSLTTTLTATVVNSDYDFIGWYEDDPDCSGTADILASACTKDGNTYTKSETLSSSTTYYALFKQKQPDQYTATLVQTSFGTLSITGGASGSGNLYNAYRGATVSLNATTSDNSKTFSRWVITNATSGADLTSTVCASPSQATTTFTMPAQAVNITAVYASKTEVNITVTSNNESLGTAEYTAGTYYVGESSIPITATPTSGLNGGKFVRWVVTGGTVTNANAASTTITNPGVTVTARAVFENKTFQLYSKKDISGNTPSTDAEKLYPMVRMSDGRYVSTRVVNKSTDTFTIYDTSTSQYARPSTIENYELHSGYTSNDIDSWYSSDKKYTIKSTDNASYYVIFDPSGGTFGTISISTTNPLGDIAQIYAKDGSIRYATEGNTSGNLWEYDRGGTTANRGVTVVTQINSTAVPNPDTKRYPSTDQSDHFKQYSAAIGNTITIQTTVNSTYQTQGFYVGMFVINGWKVEATDVGNGKYTATFTLADEYSVNNLDGAKSFEITPVYYNKNFEYVTFYVDAASVPSKWGKTISACADYNGADNAHFEGTYPGQPLGREGDLYEIKVSKYYYDYNSSTGKWSKHTNHQPSVTITAYNYDNVHHYYYVEKDDTLNTGNKNYQTYDFSDFNYLAKIPDIEAILFRCKYETSKSSWQIYNKADSEANYNATTPAWFNVDGSQSSFNTMQVLTDYYGNPIDALGNRIEKSEGVYYTADDVSTLLSQYSTNATSKVRIVSYGNRNTNTDTANSRTAAKWATGWAVYGGGSTSGTNYFIAYGNPADFICTTPGTASTSNVKYRSGKSASDLTGKITYITYDKERTNQISGVGDTGERIDGQWYYSAQHAFDSNVKVAYTTSKTSAVTSSDTTIEVDSNSANNTGYIGTTSGTKATLDGNTTHTYNNVSTEAELKATVGSGYTFVGWYIYDGSTYTKIHDNYADVNTTMTMKKNYTIIAVVRAVGAGDLVITHSRYTGNSPEAHDGTGKYYVSAVVKHSDSSTTKYAEALNSITIRGLQATDKLTISIRTVCNGVDTFYGWYEEALGTNYTRTGNYYEICNETDDPLGETEASYTFFEADCSTFFNGATLERNTIDLYSDIVHVSAYATLTYKYYDRFETSGSNQMVSYTVKNVPLDNDEIAAGFIPSDETIEKYAPKVVDTIYTDTKWTIIGTKVERAASNVTLMATQTDKDCYVLYMPNSDVATNLLQSLTTETLPETAMSDMSSKTVPFNSWLIDENADIDAPQEADFYVNAPKSYTYTPETGDPVTWKFERFDVYSYDRLTGEIGNVIYSSNDNYFGYRIYADCVIYPVYTTGNVATALTAKIEPAVLNREVYGDSASPVDRLYADLLISFINIANSVEGATLPEVIKDNNTTYSIETGVILDKSVNLNDTDFNTLKTAAINGDADTTKTVIAGYSGFTQSDTVLNFARGTETSETLTKYMNSEIAVQTMTNKNRLDKVFRYNNTEAAQRRIFAAYSYIVIRDSSNNVVASAISDAQKFNFCYVGNKPLETAS
ncbi:MAG: hypothetical protein U0L27_07330 [Ruminococcus sp.]|nr:hypothetical protein [Ruminococcus sp.]